MTGSKIQIRLPLLKVTSFTNVSTNIPQDGILLGAFMAVSASAAAGGSEIAVYGTLTFDPTAAASNTSLYQIAFLPVCLVPTATGASNGSVAVYFPFRIPVTKNQNLWLMGSGSATNLFITASVFMEPR